MDESDEDPPYLAGRWSDMSPELRKAELDIAIWDEDVREAYLAVVPVSEVPAPRKDGEAGLAMKEKNDEKWDAFEKWFSCNDSLRSAMVLREASSAMLHGATVSSAAIHGLQIDTLASAEEERRNEKR